MSLPRPIKFRKICSLPKRTRFGPLGNRCVTTDSVLMTLDEYETLRLIDLENLTQEECAQRMNVARTTVQGIYTEARKKMTDSLVNGKTLIIQGGQYEMCDGKDKICRRRRCCNKINTEIDEI